MGSGLQGLILAAVFAAPCRCRQLVQLVASSLMSDWLERDGCRSSSDRKSLNLARVLTIVFAVVQAAVAIVAYKLAIEDAIVDAVLRIAGFSTGLMLGLYALGLICAAHVGAGCTGSVCRRHWQLRAVVAFGTPLHRLLVYAGGQRHDCDRRLAAELDF